MATTVLALLEVQIANDFLKQTTFKNINAIPLPVGNSAGQNLTLQQNIPVTLPGNSSAVVTVIVADQPIQVTFSLAGTPVQFATSVCPIIIPGGATNIVLSSTNPNPTDVYVLQGA
jgi:hypothetical protein